MKVKRVIEKEVVRRKDCPYYVETQCANFTIEDCTLMALMDSSHMGFPDGSGFSPYKEISKYCPYKERK